MPHRALSNLSLRSRKSQERDEYIRDSLSSLALSDRLSSWSRNRDPKTKPFPLEFHLEWRHSDCKVMEWYNLITPPAQFTSIEHRTTLKAPFFHEFLLVYLTDGSICRLERMGDGSRVDAVRSIGCTAHDIIQWFAAGEYPKTSMSQEPSALLAHVQFPRTFDLLDVLAICYTMQQHYRTCAYTLQRYNCYFLCLTVLAILTRCAGGWEEQIDSETWPQLLDRILEDMPLMKYQDALDRFGIGVCLLLESEHPGTINLVLELLRSGLRSDAWESVKCGVANALWHKDLESSVKESLSERIDAAVQSALEGDSDASVALNTLIGPENDELYPDTEFRDPLIQEIVAKRFFATEFKGQKERMDRTYETYKMRQVEENRRFLLGIKLLSYIAGPFIGWGHFGGNESLRNSIPGMNGKIALSLRARLALGRISASMTTGRYLALSLLDFEFVEATLEHDEELLELSDLHEIYQLPVVDTRSKKLCLLHRRVKDMQWATSLKFSLSRLLVEALSDSIGSTSITVLAPKKASWTIHDMQAYIQRRIRNHAERVDTYGLAAAPLVQRDIERAMTEVWESLPQGFGRFELEVR